MNFEGIAAIVTALGAFSGSLVLFYKSKGEKRKMNTESFNIEIEAIRTAYSEMMKDQIESVVKPMEHRIDRLNKVVLELQAEIDELKSYRSKFEIAIMYIRSLCHWIDIKDKMDIEKPSLPIELREYFVKKEQ